MYRYNYEEKVQVYIFFNGQQPLSLTVKKYKSLIQYNVMCISLYIFSSNVEIQCNATLNQVSHLSGSPPITWKVFFIEFWNKINDYITAFKTAKKVK